MKNFRLQFREADIQNVADKFLKLTEGFKHFAFYGAMGSGKTTFIKALCHKLGTNDLVSSPTFSIVNEYSLTADESIYHFDFYRINSINELYDIGFYEYCNGNAYCFIEWPDKAEGIVPDDFLKVILTEEDNATRILSFTL